MAESLQANTLYAQPIEAQRPFNEFIEEFKTKITNAFHGKGQFDRLSLQRRLPHNVLAEIMSANPLSVCIPKQYGGRGAPIHECIALMSAASYQSLALSLTLSINYALFLQPVIKYAQHNVKAPIFNRFLYEQNMGGLMITEPNHGSDALNMQTFHTDCDGKFRLKGIKHWAGLTGMANYWLLTARKKVDNNLLRDLDFFICDEQAPGQQIKVEEYFDNLGLYQIPYGRNIIDVQIPPQFQLVPKTSGIQMMLDILHRSRLQFPGMGMGFIQRILDEALEHCIQRKVGGRSLTSYDQVQARLAALQANYTICSALCVGGSNLATLSDDLALLGLEANSIKSVTSDIMQESAQSLLQLVGAQGYKLNHIAGRSVVDSRPFQIFEGSNDILYIQISDAVLKDMANAKESNLLAYCKKLPITKFAAEYLKGLLDFNVDRKLAQRKQVLFGKIVSRVIALNYVFELGHKGFSPHLINGAKTTLHHYVSNQISSYSFAEETLAIEDYANNSNWFNFVGGV